MNIGILSMQKVHNYGSFLQAFSLKMQFEKRGHSVFFIDIKPGEMICRKEVVKVNLLKKIDRYFLKRIENYLLGKKMAKIHINDYETYLETQKKLKLGERFDLAVIGSDEVFNATIPSRWGFTKQLFGEIENTNCVVTYAASCGSTTFFAVKDMGIAQQISLALKNVKSLSVRDKNTYDFIETITGRKAEINVDPVFLADYDSYIVYPKIKKPFMLVYAYANRIHDETEIKTIKEYAKKNGLEIICVGMQQRWCSKNIAGNAFELLGYVKKATCILTDTFHGAVFSIKYNKKFVALVRESNKNKLESLLNQFDLEQRRVKNIQKLEQVFDAEIDYLRVNKIVVDEQEKSKKYLDMVCGLGDV